jgi:hypothetical protein
LRPPQIISLLLTVAHQCQGNIWHWQSHVWDYISTALHGKDNSIFFASD